MPTPVPQGPSNLGNWVTLAFILVLLPPAFLPNMFDVPTHLTWFQTVALGTGTLAGFFLYAVLMCGWRPGGVSLTERPE